MKHRSWMRLLISSFDNRKSKIQNRKLVGILLSLSHSPSVGLWHGAAADESPPDRIPKCYLSVRYLGPHRGIPAGSARAWVRGGEKHCH